MKCTIPEISWHNRDPVLSVDIQPNRAGDAFYRLASGGTDSHVLIWLLSVEKSGVASLECAADLTRHTKPVNCVRFSPSGEYLATGDDESCIIVWKMKTSSDPVDFLSGEEDNFKEQWISVKVLRGHLQDVYDLCWSADSKNLISGSVDNTAILWDVSTGKNLAILGDHKGFVQGVAWDPCGQFVSTISSDRMCRVYNIATRRVVSRMYKGHLPGMDAEAKPSHYFHDDTLKSFFRRLTFTPDGELLIVPSGLVEEPDKNPTNSTLIFSRSSFQKPAVYLPSLNQYTVAVRCCPVLFKLRPMHSPSLFDFPYRVVIAVATQSSVVLYDTQHAAPFAFITKIHYTRLTDLSWSSDGRVLVVSSTDGYCSVITFAENELGTVYTVDEKSQEGNEKQEDKSSSNEEKKFNDAVKTTRVSDDLNQIEEANMPVVVSNDKPLTDTKATKDSCDKITNSKSKTSASEAKDTPMEIDDFQLVYEGTLTEPVLERQTVTETEQAKTETKIEPDFQISKDSEEPSSKSKTVLESDEKPCESIKHPEQATESPTKPADSIKSFQEQALTSPNGSNSSRVSVTPGNSNKKTPRRVQLITLSSPKSKKKLLQ